MSDGYVHASFMSPPYIYLCAFCNNYNLVCFSIMIWLIIRILIIKFGFTYLTETIGFQIGQPWHMTH